MLIDVFCYEGLDVREKRHLTRAINECNSIQNYYAFIFRGENHSDWNSNPLNWEAIKKNKGERDTPEIYITNQSFDDNWFSHEDSYFSVISICNWDKNYAPPSLSTFIMYQIVQAAVCFKADICEDTSIQLEHEEPKGCMFDLCYMKPDIVPNRLRGSYSKFQAS